MTVTLLLLVLESLPKNKNPVLFVDALELTDPTAVTSVLTAATRTTPDIGIWAVRGASAAASYLSLVAFSDRPKGQMMVDQSVLRIGPSTIEGAGLGVFANQRIPGGTVLGTYPGVVMPLDQGLPKLYAHPECEVYVWRFSDSKCIIDPTDSSGKVQDFTSGGNPSTMGSLWLCERVFGALLPTVFRKDTTLCRINEPPIGRDVNIKTREDLETRVVRFIVERDVYEGEELFIDYGLTYNRAGYGGGGSGGDPN